MRERLRVVLYVGGGEGGRGGGAGGADVFRVRKTAAGEDQKGFDLFLTIYRNVKNSILTT